MASNKKCHHNLANKEITDFIVNIFQCQFHINYKTKAEIDSHHKTIKNILHIFVRLINSSSFGQDILQHNFIPIFSRIRENVIDSNNVSNAYSNDISAICKMLNDSMSLNRGDNKEHNSRKISEKKLLESYV